MHSGAAPLIVAVGMISEGTDIGGGGGGVSQVASVGFASEYRKLVDDLAVLSERDAGFTPVSIVADGHWVMSKVGGAGLE